MYRIELSRCWIDMIEKTAVFSIIVIVTVVIAMHLIRVVMRDWHIKDESTINIAILILAMVALCITFKALYIILNMWGILEIVIV